MCCGNKRTQASQTTQTQLASKSEAEPPAQPQRESDSQIRFQYLGPTGLTLVGPVSYKRYRFDHPEAIVVIDPRDKRALAGVSVLRQV